MGIVAIVGMVFLFSGKSYVMPSQSRSMMTIDTGVASGDVAGEAFKLPIYRTDGGGTGGDTSDNPVSDSSVNCIALSTGIPIDFGDPTVKYTVCLSVINNLGSNIPDNTRLSISANKWGVTENRFANSGKIINNVLYVDFQSAKSNSVMQGETITSLSKVYTLSLSDSECLTVWLGQEAQSACIFNGKPSTCVDALRNSGTGSYSLGTPGKTVCRPKVNVVLTGLNEAK